MIAAMALPLLLVMTIGSGPAQASPILPGHVTCTNNWVGTIRFVPPLFNGGSAPNEKMIVVAKMGNTANPCTTVPAGVELGAVKGLLKFVMPGANNCANVFSGTALPAPTAASKFKMTWSAPAGAPTIWRQPGPFAVTGALAMTDITINGGALTAGSSFPAPPPPSATLSGTGWPATIAAACASTTGLAHLALATSTGSW
jgi:hypothetical protein